MLSKKEIEQQKPLKQKLMQQSRNSQWQRSDKAKKWRQDRAQTPEYKAQQKDWRDNNPDKVQEYNQNYKEKRLKLIKKERAEVITLISQEAAETIINTNLSETEKGLLHGYVGDLKSYLEEHTYTWSVRGVQRAWLYEIVPFEFLYVGYEGLFIPRLFGEALSRNKLSGVKQDQSKQTRYERDDTSDLRKRLNKQLGK